jgi:ATP-binding cassette subfamily B (MDR/TAP) protein 6
VAQVELFKHLHGLSLRWHLSRKTGEVLRVMDRGTDSITNLLNYIIFSILPTVVDILVAVGYFIAAFNGWFGLIVFVTMLLYIGKQKVA